MISSQGFSLHDSMWSVDIRLAIKLQETYLIRKGADKEEAEEKNKLDYITDALEKLVKRAENGE